MSHSIIIHVEMSCPTDRIMFSIFFFYRPKVQPAGEVDKTGKAAGSIDDVQNTHMSVI